MLFYFSISWIVISFQKSAHWAKNRGQKVINNKIEKFKIMYLLVGFSPLLWIKTISKNFVTDFSDFFMKFWEISKKCSNFVNFRARNMFFYFKTGPNFTRKRLVQSLVTLWRPNVIYGDTFDEQSFSCWPTVQWWTLSGV